MNNIVLSMFELEELRLEAESRGCSLDEFIASLFLDEGDMHLSETSFLPEGDMHLVAISTN